MKEGSSYLIKRGTAHRIAQIYISVDNITIGTFGEGDRPVIMGGETDFMFRVSGAGGIKFSGLHIKGSINNPSAIFIQSLSEDESLSEFDVVIEGCVIEGTERGITSTNGYTSIAIRNSYIHNIHDDAIFLQDVGKIEVRDCFIIRANQKFFVNQSELEAPGDGIQLSRCGYFEIINCVIDRSDTGNKFNIIANGCYGGGLIDNCLIIMPFDAGFGGAGIYFGHDGREHTGNVVVRNNKFIATSLNAIYNHGENNAFENNIFFNTARMFTDKPATLKRNTWVGITPLIGPGFLHHNNTRDDNISIPSYTIPLRFLE